MVKAYWYNETKNVGDNLTKIILEHLSKKEVVLSHDKGSILGVGSIAEFIQDGDVVWGSGLIEPMALEKKKDVTFLAVRGKYTRDYLMMAGYEVPEVYADPAILMPEIYFPKVEKEHKFGYVPHYIEKDEWPTLTRGDFFIDILSEPFAFVDELLKCEAILTSSLHAHILARAYGIPSKFFPLTNKIIGGYFKFWDYETANTSATELKNLIMPYLK